MSNSFNPEQARRFVGPGLGQNYLKRLSADDISKNAEVQCHMLNMMTGDIPYDLFSIEEMLTCRVYNMQISLIMNSIIAHLNTHTSMFGLTEV